MDMTIGEMRRANKIGSIKAKLGLAIEKPKYGLAMASVTGKPVIGYKVVGHDIRGVVLNLREVTTRREAELVLRAQVARGSKATIQEVTA